MKYIGKIDRNIYRCVAEKIITDDVVITSKQIEHIKERHKGHYEQFAKYFSEIVLDPDYILEANKPGSAIILKEISLEQQVFKVVLRLVTATDDTRYKNSIITFMKIDRKEWDRLLRNKKILYSKVSK